MRPRIDTADRPVIAMLTGRSTRALVGIDPRQAGKNFSADFLQHVFNTGQHFCKHRRGHRLGASFVACAVLGETIIELIAASDVAVVELIIVG